MAEWMPVLVAQAWQVTLLIVVVAAINRWVGKSRPHLAHALWLVVLVKCVTPPVWSSPSGLFCWLQPARETIGEPLADESASRNWSELLAETSEFDLDDATGRSRRRESSDEVETDAAITELSRVRLHTEQLRLDSEVPSPIKANTVEWPRILLGAWGLASLVVIAVAVARWLRCWRMLRNASRRESAELSEQLDLLAKKLRLRRRVRLIVTESRLGPAVIGLFRTTVLLPALIVDRLGDSARRMAALGRPASFDSQTGTSEGDHPTSPLAPILAHELLHIRRGDLWVGLLQTLAQAVWWCHPLVWWVNRRTTREAERCCDEEVLAELGCDPAAYARALVDVLELKRELKPVPVFPGVRPVEVTTQRLERIMQLGQGCQRRTPWWCWLLAALAAAVTWPGAAFVVTAEDGKSVESPQPAETTRKLSTGVGVNSDSGVIGEAVLEKPNDSPAMPPETAERILANEFWPAVQAWLTILGPIPEGSIAEVRVQGNRLVTTDEFLAMIQSKQGEPINEAQIRKDVRALLATRRFMSVTPRFEKSDKGPVLVFRVIERSVIERVEFSGNKLIATEDLEKVAELRAGSPFEVSACREAARRMTEHYRSKGFSTALIYPKFEQTKEGQLRDYKVIFKIVEGAVREVMPPSETRWPAADGTKLQLDSLGQLHWQHGSWFVAILPAPGTKLINAGELPNKFRSDGQVKMYLSKMAQGFSSKDQIVMAADEFELFANENGQQIRLGGGVHLNGRGFQATCDSLVLSLARGLEAVGVEPQITALLGQTRLRRQVNGEKTELKAGQVLLYLNGTEITKVQRDSDGLVATLRDPPSREATLIQQGRSMLAITKPEHLVSVNFENVPLKEAIKQLAQFSGRNIVLEKPGLEEEALTEQTPITLAVDRVKLSSALKLMLDPLNLGYRIEESGVVVVTSQQRLKGQPIVATYSVADLTVPIPKRAVVKLAADRSVAGNELKPSDPAKSMLLQLPELVKLITSTCQPNSWEEVGGNGRIKANDSTLSLVVRQTRDVHEEIRDLLKQLRRLQQTQVALQIETWTVPNDFWERLRKLDVDLQDFPLPDSKSPAAALALPESPTNRFLLPSPNPPAAAPLLRLAVLLRKEAKLLGSVCQTKLSAKITLHNGQELELIDGLYSPPTRLILKPVLFDELKRLRLHAAVMKHGDVEPDAKPDFTKCAVALDAGNSLLLDVFPQEFSVVEESITTLSLNGITKKNLGKRDVDAAHRTLLLITGQVVVAEEEEALLGIPN